MLSGWCYSRNFLTQRARRASFFWMYTRLAALSLVRWVRTRSNWSSLKPGRSITILLLHDLCFMINFILLHLFYPCSSTGTYRYKLGLAICTCHFSCCEGCNWFRTNVMICDAYKWIVNSDIKCALWSMLTDFCLALDCSLWSMLTDPCNLLTCLGMIFWSALVLFSFLDVRDWERWSLWFCFLIWMTINLWFMFHS